MKLQPAGSLHLTSPTGSKCRVMNNKIISLSRSFSREHGAVCQHYYITLDNIYGRQAQGSGIPPGLLQAPVVRTCGSSALLRQQHLADLALAQFIVNAAFL